MSENVLEDMERKRAKLLDLIREYESGRMIPVRNSGALVLEWKARVAALDREIAARKKAARDPGCAFR